MPIETKPLSAAEEIRAVRMSRDIDREGAKQGLSPAAHEDVYPHIKAALIHYSNPDAMDVADALTDLRLTAPFYFALAPQPNTAAQYVRHGKVLTEQEMRKLEPRQRLDVFNQAEDAKKRRTH